MDNNNLPTPNPVPPPVPNVVDQMPKKEENKMVLWLIAGLVVIVLVAGGIYLYLSPKQKVTPTKPTSTSSPTSQENLENELNTVNVEDVENDFSSVDQDLQNL